jgi:hypothetical protein
MIEVKTQVLEKLNSITLERSKLITNLNEQVKKAAEQYKIIEEVKDNYNSNVLEQFIKESFAPINNIVSELGYKGLNEMSVYCENGLHGSLDSFFNTSDISTCLGRILDYINMYDAPSE